MTDNEILFFAVILLYLSECLFWVDSLGIAYVRSYKNWRVAFPSAFFGNAKGGLAMAWPFPFLGRVYLSYILPVSFSQEGIVNITLERTGTKITIAAADQPKRILYKDIASVGHEGNNLIINGEVFCNCGSSRQASFVDSMLQDVIGSEKYYGKIERHIHALFDTSRLKKCEDDLLKHAKHLMFFCNIQLIILLVVCPILVIFFGTQALIASGIYMILANLSLVYLYHHVHREVYKGFRDGHFTDIAKMILSPPLTIRALDLLSLHYFIAFHPLTVAYHVLDRHSFMLFAKQMLLSYNHTYVSFDGVDHKDALLWHLKSIEASIKELLIKKHISVSDLLRPPSQVEGVASYCPRCHAQYVQKSGQCEDCGGIDLTEYTGNDNGKN